MQRTEYGSCTRGSPLRCEATFGLPAISARRFAATACWPGCGRVAWSSSSQARSVERSASADIAPTTSADAARTSPSCSARQPIAVMTWVPLMSATPSFGSSSTRFRPAAFRASPPARRTPFATVSPSPMSTSAACARGARSPEAPTLPCIGIAGWTRRLSMSQRRSMTSARTPDRPAASVFARRSRTARTDSSGRSGPTPTAWLRTRLRCRARSCSCGTRTAARSPKPVFTPYTASSCSAISATTLAACCTCRSAARSRPTATSRRATETTSAMVRSCPVRRRVVRRSALRLAIFARQLGVVPRGVHGPAVVLGADIADDPRRDADDDLASRHRHAVWKDGPGRDDAPVADAIAADQYRTAADEHVVADRAVVNDRSMPDRALHTNDGRTIGLRVHDDVVLHARARADPDRGHISSERGVVPDRSAGLYGYVADQARGGRDPRVRRDGRALSAIWIERHARMVCAPSSSVPSDRESKGGVQRPIRVLLAKVGLDGHDRGVKIVARALRDAGMEVVYTGLHRRPEEVIAAAAEEDVDLIGVSILSGAHLTIFPKLTDLMKKERGFGEMLLVAGGVIPEDDVARLRRLGVDAVIDQEASADELVGTVRALVEARRAAGADR